MKKIILILCCILAFLSVSATQNVQDETISRSFPLTGFLDRSAPFIISDGTGPKSILNMVRVSSGIPAGWKSRAGMEKNNSTAINSGTTVESLHQYSNSEHDIDALIVQGGDGNIYLADNFPPSTGTTFGSSIYSLTSGAGQVWCDKIGNDLTCVASGTSPFGFSGGTAYPDTCLVSRSSTTEYHVGTDFVRDNNTATTFTIMQSDSEIMYIGYRRRIDGIYLDLVPGTENTAASGISVFARRSAAWTEVSGPNDGTSSGVTTLYQSGLISWTASNLDEPYVMPYTTNHLFWYKIITTADIDDGVKVYRIRITEDCQDLTALWSGFYELADGVLMSSVTGYENWTAETTNNTDADYLDVGDLTSSYGIYVGLIGQKAFGIRLTVDSEYNNTSTASAVSAYYFNAVTETFTDAGTVTDGTSNGGIALHHTGEILWDGNSISEDPHIMGDIPYPMYWYKLVWSATLPSDIHIWDIALLVKPETSPPYPQYDGVINHNGRAFFWPGYRNKGGFDFSAIDRVHVNNGATALNGFNGGGETRNFASGTITCAKGLHSYTIFCTKDPYQTFILEGKTPASLDELCISHTIGAIAPKSMVLVEDNVRGFNQLRNVHAVLFLSHTGIFMVDGMTIRGAGEPDKISGAMDDLFDSGTTPYIEMSQADESYAWVDYVEKTVHFAVPINTTGTGTQKTLNYEIVYNYLTGEWYDRVLRANPARCGLAIIGSDNRRVVYVGDYSGFVHRCDSGVTTDNGTAIHQELIVNDFSPLAGILPDFINYSVILRSVKIKTKAKDSGNVAISIYPNGKTTGISLGNISMINDGYGISMGKVSSEYWGETFAIEFDAGSSSAEPMEIYGYSIDFQKRRETQ